jgi:hypothetical protein
MSPISTQSLKHISIHATAEHSICNQSSYMTSAIRGGQVPSIGYVTIVEVFRIGTKKDLSSKRVHRYIAVLDG